MTVAKLKQILQEQLDNLEQFDDNQTVKMVSNTYFLGHPYYFLGVAGYDGGYISFDDPVVEDDEEEYDCEIISMGE